MWTTLKTVADWDEYKQTAAKALRVPGDWVNWGNPPASYPCLVCSHMPAQLPGSSPRVYTAMVYEQDAEDLLSAAGKKLANQDAVPLPNQTQFNRWISAQIMVLIDTAIRTGLLAPRGGEAANREAFETKLLEALELVDSYTDDKKQELAAKTTSSMTTLLSALKPPK